MSNTIGGHTHVTGGMPKGKSGNPGGRPKGSKDSRDAKLMKKFFVKWLVKMGQKGFEEWANQNKTEMMRIGSRFVPQEVANVGDKPLIVVQWPGSQGDKPE